VTSHGGRFKRRALRRGYKVDEVDAFLDRVEATVAGEPIDTPVTAQEVHDVAFRVRFGGYDEWQVDLHLDRVERQLAEAAERSQMFGPGRPGAPPGAPPMPQRPSPAGAGPGRPPEPGYGPPPYEEAPTYAGEPAYPEPEPTHGGPPERFHDMTTEMPVGDHTGPPPEHGPPPGRPAGPPAGPPPGHLGGPPPGHPGGPPPGRPGGPPHPGGPPPHAPVGPPQAGPPQAGPPQAGPPPMSPGPAGPSLAGAPVEVQRVDQLRRSFQPRRFGSGYDRAQVDQLFEEVIAGMSGQAPMSVSEAQLDPRRFDLVSGGYFEGDVDHALQEVRDILRRR
jgi:DivIVA domain-containing protein